MAAAVADFRPERPIEDKLSKEGRESLTVALVATADVLAEAAGMRREGQLIVGFAAEHGPEALGRAKDKLARKGLDAIVVNDISRPDIGFDSDQNEVVILGRAGELHVPRSSKEDVAARVLDFVQEMRNKQVVHVGFGSHINDLRGKCRHRIDLGRDRLFRRAQRGREAAETARTQPRAASAAGSRPQG